MGTDESGGRCVVSRSRLGKAGRTGAMVTARDLPVALRPRRGRRTTPVDHRPALGPGIGGPATTLGG